MQNEFIFFIKAYIRPKRFR